DREGVQPTVSGGRGKPYLHAAETPKPQGCAGKCARLPRPQEQRQQEAITEHQQIIEIASVPNMSRKWVSSPGCRGRTSAPLGRCLGFCPCATVEREAGGITWRKRSGFTSSATRKKQRPMEWITSAFTCFRH